MHVFLTGGSGFVGGHLIERLVRDGHTVSALARSDRSAAVVERFGARAVRGDLSGVVRDQLEGVDAVVHAAARAEDWGPSTWFEHANVQGTSTLLQAAQAAGVTAFVHIGTEAAFFDGSDLVDVDESVREPARHRFHYSRTKAQAERLVLQANSPSMRTLSIRPRLVWGPRDASVRPALLESVASGGFWWMDGGRARTSTCHVHNLAHAVALALDSDVGGQALFVTDGTDRSMRQVMTGLASTAGVTLPDRSLPGWLGRWAGAAVEAVWSRFRPGQRPPMTAMATAMLAATVTVRDDQARRLLGYAPVVSWEQGLTALTPPHVVAQVPAL